jgi:hypothetical protein
MQIDRLDHLVMTVADIEKQGRGERGKKMHEGKNLWLDI